MKFFQFLLLFCYWFVTQIIILISEYNGTVKMKVSVTLRKKLTSKGQSLYLDIYSNGIRNYEFLGFTLTGNKKTDRITLDNAEEIRIKKLAELQRDSFGLTIDKKISLRNLIKEVIGTKPNDKTKDVYQKLLNHIIIFDSIDRKISSINLDYIERFKTYLLSKMTNNSARIYLTVLKSSFNFALRKEYFSNNPMQNFIFPKKIETEKDFLTIDELRKLELLDFQSESLRAFLFACYTGLRFSDIKKLKYEDISNGKLKVRMKKTDSFIYIPINNKANSLIGNIFNIKGNVFKLQSHMTVNRQLKYIFMLTGIKKNKVSFHLARHSFATIGLTLGIELETISKILGHRSLSTTQIYAKIVNEKIDNAMNKFNQI